MRLEVPIAERARVAYRGRDPKKEGHRIRVEMLETREVRTNAELGAVGRLRYAVYVDEMRRHQRYADHSARSVLEPLDEKARVLATFAGDRVVGTVRTNIGRESGFGEYEDLYTLRRFGPYFPECVSVTTKLIVDRAYRHGSVAARLVQGIYDCGIANGVRFDVIDCNTPLLPLFVRLGHRRLFPDIEHPEYGTVHPHVLVLHDDDHLRAVGSPLYRRGGRLRADPSVAFFRDHIASVSAPVDFRVSVTQLADTPSLTNSQRDDADHP